MTSLPGQNSIAGDPEILHAQARRRVVDWVERARVILQLSRQALPVPDVRFDLRGQAAGQAILARRKRRQDAIRINAGLLTSHPDEMLAQTVPHEVAHVAIHRAYGSRVRPHGPEWRALMQAFGVAPHACHKLPASPSRQLTRYRYRCDCERPAWLTSIRHNRVLRGTRYNCRYCGARLEYRPE